MYVIIVYENLFTTCYNIEIFVNIFDIVSHCVK